MVELAYTADLKFAALVDCGFESRLGHLLRNSMKINQESQKAITELAATLGWKAGFQLVESKGSKYVDVIIFPVLRRHCDTQVKYDSALEEAHLVINGMLSKTPKEIRRFNLFKYAQLGVLPKVVEMLLDEIDLTSSESVVY